MPIALTQIGTIFNAMCKVVASKSVLSGEQKVTMEPQFYQVAALISVKFANGMDEVFKSKSPPSIEYLLSLPTPQVKTWAVYCVVMQDPLGEHFVYIGSGTGADGCRSRTRIYTNDAHPSLPSRVHAACGNDFKLLHVGTIYTAKIPQPSQFPLARLCFLALEGCMTCLLYSLNFTTVEPYWRKVMPWQREDVTWGSLNSHTALCEGLGDLLEQTPEQLELIAAMRKEKQAQNSIDHRERERAKDLDAYRLRQVTTRKAWADNNREKLAARRAEDVSGVKSEGRFKCNGCDLPLQSPVALKPHLETAAHRRQVATNAGIAPPAPSASSILTRESEQRAKAEKRNFCAACNFNGPSAAKLRSHLKTRGHAKKIAGMQQSAASSA